jgi:uroporphyrin-III C-methyltransferase
MNPSDLPSPTPFVTSAPSRAWLSGLSLLVALVSLLAAVWLWVKLGSVQELLARQTSDSGSLATEAKSAARQAEELARDNAARLSLAEAKITEVNLQRTQLDQLMQSLSRARDENMLADLEAALRLAQQQTQLTGSLQPLVAALRMVDTRLNKQANPRFTTLQRSVARDIERLTSTTVPDTPALLARLDDLMSQIDQMPMANAVGQVNLANTSAQAPAGWRRAISTAWWAQLAADLWDDIKGLVRVSRIDQPEAMLMAPDQAYFLRENMKLRVLNARLGLISRQFEGARADLVVLQRDMGRYFDGSSKTVNLALSQVQQMQTEMLQVKLPRIDETLAALEALSAGR